MFHSPLLSPPNISFLDHFCLSSLRQSTANYSMSCLSNSKAFVPLALRLIGLCGLPESRCYIIDAVSFFSVYRQYTNKLPPLWHKHWDAVDAYVCVCVSTTCSNFSVLVMLALGYLLDRIWIRVLHTCSLISIHKSAVMKMLLILCVPTFVEYRSAACFCSELKKKICLDGAERRAVVHRPICLNRRRGVDAWWEPRWAVNETLLENGKW